MIKQNSLRKYNISISYHLIGSEGIENRARTWKKVIYDMEVPRYNDVLRYFYSTGIAAEIIPGSVSIEVEKEHSKGATTVVLTCQVRENNQARWIDAVICTDLETVNQKAALVKINGTYIGYQVKDLNIFFGNLDAYKLYVEGKDGDVAAKSFRKRARKFSELSLGPDVPGYIASVEDKEDIEGHGIVPCTSCKFFDPNIYNSGLAGSCTIPMPPQIPTDISKSISVTKAKLGCALGRH